MKKVLYALPALAVFGVLAGGPLPGRDHDHVYPLVEKDEVRKTVRISGPAAAVEVSVDNVWGGITVESHTGSDIEMIARRTIMAESKEKVELARREVTLDIPEKPNALSVYVDGPFRCDERNGRHGIRSRRDPGYIVKYDFELKVPFRTKLVLSTVMDGDAYSDFPVTSLPVAAAEARKEGSRTVLKSDRFFGVRVGKGGPEIKLETLNGDILIKKNA